VLDLGVFTTPMPSTALPNDAGIWTCRLHPFELAKETPA
jgi:hypothetical protein